MQLVAPGSGSSLEAWEKMGRPALPTLQQIAQLREASELLPPQTVALNQPLILGPKTLALLEIER